MQKFIPIAQQILLQNVMGGRSNGTSEMGKVRLSFYAFSGLLVIASIIFIIYGSHLYFLSGFSKDVAFILTGAVCLFFGMIVISTLAAIYYYKLCKYKKLKSEITNFTSDALDILQEEVESPIVRNPKTAVLLASLVGYLIGEKL